MNEDNSVQADGAESARVQQQLQRQPMEDLATQARAATDVPTSLPSSVSHLEDTPSMAAAQMPDFAGMLLKAAEEADKDEDSDSADSAENRPLRSRRSSRKRRQHHTLSSAIVTSDSQSTPRLATTASSAFDSQAAQQQSDANSTEDHEDSDVPPLPVTSTKSTRKAKRRTNTKALAAKTPAQTKRAKRTNRPNSHADNSFKDEEDVELTPEMERFPAYLAEHVNQDTIQPYANGRRVSIKAARIRAIAKEFGFTLNSKDEFDDPKSSRIAFRILERTRRQDKNGLLTELQETLPAARGQNIPRAQLLAMAADEIRALIQEDRDLQLAKAQLQVEHNAIAEAVLCEQRGDITEQQQQLLANQRALLIARRAHAQTQEAVAEAEQVRMREVADDDSGETSSKRPALTAAQAAAEALARTQSTALPTGLMPALTPSQVEQMQIVLRMYHQQHPQVAQLDPLQQQHLAYQALLQHQQLTQQLQLQQQQQQQQQQHGPSDDARSPGLQQASSEQLQQQQQQLQLLAQQLRQAPQPHVVQRAPEAALDQQTTSKKEQVDQAVQHTELSVPVPECPSSS